MQKRTHVELTLLRKPRNAWAPLEIAMVAMHFGAIVGSRNDYPQDLALVGAIEKEVIEGFRLAHPEFSDVEVLRTLTAV